MIHIGLDVGSTTVKVVVMDENLNTINTSYQRHFSDTRKTVCECLEKLANGYKDEEMTIALTGSRSFICFGTSRNDIYSRGSILQKIDREIYTKNRCSD